MDPLVNQNFLEFFWKNKTKDKIMEFYKDSLNPHDFEPPFFHFLDNFAV